MNKHRELAIGCVFVLAGIITITAIAAQAVALVLVTAESGGTQLGRACNGGGNTVGWKFTVGANDLAATALGEFDQNGDGLGMDVEVGLWDSAGALLGKVRVASGTSPTLIGDFRYAAFDSPVVLQSGQTYTLGSRCTNENFYVPAYANYGPIDHVSATISSDFASAAVDGRYNNGGDSTIFSEPTQNLGGDGTFFFGPNLQYELAVPTQTPTQIPPTASNTPIPTSTPTLSPPADAFACYGMAASREPAASGVLSLMDELGTTQAKSHGPSRLCSPIEAGEPDAFSQRDGYLAYRLAAHPRRRSTQTVSNTYGRQTLNIFGSGRLLMPSAIRLAGLTVTPAALDPFTCYAARAAQGTPKWGPQTRVMLQDQFGPFEARVGRPIRLCLPSTTDGEIPTSTDRLLCYRLAPTRRVTIGRVFVGNDFGSATLIPLFRGELCVRSTPE